MKRLSRLFSITLLLFFTFQAAAQSEQKETINFLPKAGDLGASIIVDGLLDNIRLTSNTNNYGQNILFAKYYLKDDIAIRGGFAL